MQRQTVLTALRDTGFLTYDDPHIGAANTALIVTGGGLGEDGGNRGATMARFAAGLALMAPVPCSRGAPGRLLEPARWR